MTSRSPSPWLVSLLCVLPGCALVGEAEPEVTLTKSAVVYCGGAACARPATIDAAAVMVATPEWRQRQGAAEAERAALERAVHERIAAACRKVAAAQDVDLVVRKGDIVDARGKAVADITAAVIAAL